MSDEERPLPPHLQALLDHERTPPALDEARRAAILRNVESSLGTSTPASPPSPSPPTSAGAPNGLLRTLGTLVVGGVIGAGAYATLAPRDSGTAPPPSVAVAPSAVVVAAPSVIVSAAPAPVVVPTASITTARAPVNVSPSGSTRVANVVPSALPAEPIEVRTSSLAEERALVERARAALGRRDSLSALEALAEHGRTFADGKLAEEREALLVQALAANGRADDARRKAAAFRARYPQSVFGTRVDATIRELDARR